MTVDIHQHAEDALRFIRDAMAGVEDRAIKYGVLVMVLTFLTIVCYELTLGLRFHPLQYGVVGVALVVFYLALLSLSGRLLFGNAYLVSTVPFIGLIAG
jgi:inner membrane protein